MCQEWLIQVIMLERNVKGRKIGQPIIEIEENNETMANLKNSKRQGTVITNMYTKPKNAYHNTKNTTPPW